MINIGIYFNRGSSTSFNIEKKDKEFISNKKWWKTRIENEIIKDSKKLVEVLEIKDKYFFYEFRSLSNNIQFKSRLLEALYTGSDQNLIILKSNGYKEYGAVEGFDIYMNEFEYRESVRDFINNNFHYNKNIKFDKKLLKITNPNCEEKLTTKIIEKLQTFNFNNIHLDFKKINKRIYELNKNKSYKLISIINKLKINEEIKVKDNIIKKIKSIFPKKENLYDKSAIIFKMKDVNIYYEQSFFNNSLIFINIKEEEYQIGYNGNIGTLCDLFYYFNDEVLEEDYLTFPKYEITDDETNQKILELF